MKFRDTWSNSIPFREFRVPYFPELFPETSKILGLKGHEKLLDIACGTGKLAFGFAPYVASLTGVDVELPMLENARQYANANDIKINLIHSKVEDMPQDIGSFDVVTIGKAHWFLDASKAVPKIDALLAEEGKILVCLAHSESPWASTFLRVREKWANFEKPHITPDNFFAGSSFGRSGMIVLEKRHVISPDYLVKRAFAIPGTTVASLGDKAEDFAADLKQSLSPFLVNNELTETLKNIGYVFSRNAINRVRRMWY
ncbi:MAG: class I SAM-dependent methyltransferase [Gallionellaceae bacterium]